MAQSKSNKLGKLLLAAALENFYAFNSDEIENKLNEALLRFENKSPDWRKKVRGYLWSFPKIRNAICQEALSIWG